MFHKKYFGFQKYTSNDPTINVISAEKNTKSLVIYLHTDSSQPYDSAKNLLFISELSQKRKINSEQTLLQTV